MVKENRFLIKYLVFFFLVAALIINWNKISWIFNYKAVFGFVSDLFSQKQEIKKLEKIEEKPSLKNQNEKEENIKEELAEKTKADDLEKGNHLEIPKLEISVPLLIVKNQNEIIKALDRGVVLFPGSVFPGEKGQTIILGHSAPPDWPKIKYDWVFSRLNELVEGDEVFIYFENKKYSYYVKEKIFLEKGGELPSSDLTNYKNMLILISCWPPGKDWGRVVVLCVLVFVL